MRDGGDGWRTEPGGILALESGALRAVLKERPAGRYVRFLVLRRPAGQDGRSSPGVLLASGTEESVPAAMRAAERTLARMTGRPPPMGGGDTPATR